MTDLFGHREHIKPKVAKKGTPDKVQGEAQPSSYPFLCSKFKGKGSRSFYLYIYLCGHFIFVCNIT